MVGNGSLILSKKQCIDHANSSPINWFWTCHTTFQVKLNLSRIIESELFSCLYHNIRKYGKFHYYYTIKTASATYFFTCKNFVSNARPNLAKNQTNAKKHPEAELLLFENYSHSLSMLSSKNNGTYSKK